MRTNMSDQFTSEQRKAWNVRKLRYSTWEYNPEPGVTIIRQHATDIVRKENGKIILNSGGWKTVTTKARMNDAISKLGCTLYSDKGQWYVTKWTEEDGIKARWAVPYFDGITIP